MKMIDVLEGYRGKWVSLALTSGQGAFLQGVVKDVGEDYVILTECNDHEPVVFNLRNITYVYALKVKDNGKPRMFS